MGLSNLPDHFFGIIFSFDEKEILPKFLYYLCGHFEVSSKLDFFFPVLISRELDEHLVFVALNSPPDKFEMILESWLQRIDDSMVDKVEISKRISFILNLLNDFFFDKEYLELDLVIKKIRGLSDQKISSMRNEIDSKLNSFLYNWLFRIEIFSRFVQICPSETITLYLRLVYKNENLDDEVKFTNIGEILSNKNESFHDNNMDIFKNCHPNFNKFCSELFFSNYFEGHIFLLIIAKMSSLNFHESKLLM